MDPPSAGCRSPHCDIRSSVTGKVCGRRPARWRRRNASGRERPCRRARYELRVHGRSIRPRDDIPVICRPAPKRKRRRPGIGRRWIRRHLGGDAADSRETGRRCAHVHVVAHRKRGPVPRERDRCHHPTYSRLRTCQNRRIGSLWRKRGEPGRVGPHGRRDATPPERSVFPGSRHWL